MAIPEVKLTTMQGHTGAVNEAVFSSDGNYCLTASADRTVKLWNPHTGLKVASFNGHGKEVLGITVCPGDNSQFVSCGGDRNVLLWDVATGKTAMRFSSHTHRVNSVSINAESTVIASASYDSTVRLWDPRQPTKKTIQVLKQAKDSVESVEIDGYEIITGSVDGYARIFDIRSREIIEDFVDESITAVTQTHDKNCILISSLDERIRLLDKQNGELLAEYKGHTNTQYRSIPCVKKQDDCIIGGSEDGKVYFWDLVGESIKKIISAHSAAVTSIRYHPSMDLMLTTSLDGLCKLWST